MLVPLEVLFWLAVAVLVGDALNPPEPDLELLSLLPSSSLAVPTGGLVVAGDAPPVMDVASSTLRTTWKLCAVASCNAKMRQSKAQI